MEVVIVIISASSTGGNSSTIIKVIPDLKERTLGVHPPISVASTLQLLSCVGIIIIVIARLAARCRGQDRNVAAQ